MKASLGNFPRKKLADISNIPEGMRFTRQNEKSEEFVDKIQKENAALMRIIAEKSKITEIAGAEIQKMRINLQKMQQQNHELAQSNSQMLLELNSAKDRLKALQHELGCKNGILKAKELEAQEIAKQKMCQQLNDEVKPIKCEEAEDSSLGYGNNDRPAKIKRKPQAKSLGSSTQVPPQDKAENKRPCVRRQSARFKHEAPQHTTTSTSQSQATKHDEDYFEVEDKCVSMVNQVQQNGSDLESNPALRFESIEFGRSSLSRPLRHAAKKVQSYKEVPLNIKMRRPV